MNLINQRSDLKIARDEKLLSASQLAIALSCPVFLSSTQRSGKELSAKEWEFLSTSLMELNPSGIPVFPLMSPFPAFRIAYTDEPVYEQWFINKNDALCLRLDDGYSQKGITFRSLQHMSRADKKIKFFCTINGKPLDAETMKAGRIQVVDGKDGINAFASSAIRWLSFFLLDVMSPNNVMVKVEPENVAKTRSVEWCLARTHYLIIPRNHAVSCRERLGGPTDDEIVMAAHWRRAHLRRLMSEKFIHKRGQLVPVKSAWVGPTEWTGLDGKVYKIVEPPQLRD